MVTEIDKNIDTKIKINRYRFKYLYVQIQLWIWFLSLTFVCNFTYKIYTHNFILGTAAGCRGQENQVLNQTEKNSSLHSL